MTDEQSARVKTWINEWKLAGRHASELYAGEYVDVRLRNGKGCHIALSHLSHYPSTTWVVWEPKVMVPRDGTFCNTLEEALDLASERLRESV